MWRLIFSKKKLSAPARSALQVILEDVSYTCGASLDDLDLPDNLKQVVIRYHNCGDPIEKLYYSAGFEDICIHCAATSDLVENLPESAYPLCHLCSVNKQPSYKKK